LRASDLATNEALAEANQRSVELQQKSGAKYTNLFLNDQFANKFPDQLLRDYNASLQDNEVLRSQLDDNANSKAALEKQYQAKIQILQEQINSLQVM
jgi:endonuclease/exonuclease/phosphatase (EEP) superfamily protein YafD